MPGTVILPQLKWKAPKRLPVIFFVCTTVSLDFFPIFLQCLDLLQYFFVLYCFHKCSENLALKQKHNTAAYSCPISPPSLCISLSLVLSSLLHPSAPLPLCLPVFSCSPSPSHLLIICFILSASWWVTSKGGLSRTQNTKMASSLLS